MARRSLTQARVIVTGASSGIGRELALAMAGYEAQLLLVARRGELLDAACRECIRLGGSAHAFAGDVADDEFRRQLVDQAQQALGGLDVLVNNAGVSAHGQFADSDEQALRQIMEVNFFAPVELTRLALPLLLAKLARPPSVRPAIVNVGSILGHRGVPLNGEYCASKFALRGWTESLRTELYGRGVDVILASPGSTDTQFFDHLVSKTADLPWGAAKGVPAAAVAAEIVRAIQRGRREVFPNWRGRAMVVANRWFPGLVERRLRSYLQP